MSPGERANISNGIFLCSTCASLVDKNNGADFSVAQLKAWKTEHEQWITDKYNKNSMDEPSQTFNVTSNNQMGGITAGVVNQYERSGRTLNDQMRKDLLQKLPDKTRQVSIQYSVGDPEVKNLADTIFQFLNQNGFAVEFSAVFNVLPPLGFDASQNVIAVGPRPPIYTS